MQCEIEDVVLYFTATVEVALLNYDFILQGPALGQDFAGGCNNTTATNQVAAFFPARLGDADYPGSILVSPGLHYQVVVKVLQMIVLGGRRILYRGIVAKHDHFDTLQTHDPECFGPAAVITNTHTHSAAETL